ncbi:hypothetical protein VPH35_031569 [Triticum aestivum]
MANHWDMAGESVPEITSSTSTTNSIVTTTLSFQVTAEYPNLETMGVDECARSRVFRFGGYHWCIEFYPYGWWAANVAGKAMAYLCYLSKAGSVYTKYTASTRRRESFLRQETSFFFRKASKELKPLPELVDGGFTLQYILTICKNVSPPMELPGHLERMLGKQRGADITFRVRGRDFSAHSFLLAERSPKDMARIEVADMEPAIFHMMLHYIYTDILPSCNDQGGRTTALMQQLLAAADRYGLDRLKLMCEEELCRRIDAETIMSMHALAHRYHCDRLKHACLQFLTWSPEVLADVFESSGFNELCMTNYRPLPLEGEVSWTKRSHAEEETHPVEAHPQTRRRRRADYHDQGHASDIEHHRHRCHRSHPARPVVGSTKGINVFKTVP